VALGPALLVATSGKEVVATPCPGQVPSHHHFPIVLFDDAPPAPHKVKKVSLKLILIILAISGTGLGLLLFIFGCSCDVINTTSVPNYKTLL